MKVTRVGYTVRAEFVEENKRNIAAVMRQLREEFGSHRVADPGHFHARSPV